MSDVGDRQRSDLPPVVERGERYDHAEHGRIRVTGIWKGVQQVDTARNADETGVIIVRYATERGGDEFTDTLDEFLAAVERGDGLRR